MLRDSGLHTVPGEGCGGKGRRTEWRRPTWPGSAGCPPGERAERLWAGGARCLVQGAAGRAGELRALPLPFLLLPLLPPSSTSKSTHERGFPGRRAAQPRLCGAAAFIAVRQTGRNSHFPPGWSPARAGRPGAHFNPLRASGARPGRPSCLLTAAWAQKQRAGRPPSPVQSSDRVSGCPDREVASLGSQGRSGLGLTISASRGA